MKKTLSQLLEGLLSKPHARLKFSEIRNELTRLSGQTISQKEVENAIAVLREKRRDLVYAKFDRTFYLSNTPTWYSNSTDLSRKMPKDGYFGIVSDTHLGSHAERLDILNQAYNAFQKRGIKTVFHIGDVTDGFNQYRGHAQHVKVYGNAAQAIYAIKNYPQRKGITTYAIGGNHDDDHNIASVERLGLVVNGLDYEGKHYIGRKDIIYLGPYSHTVILPQQVTMHLLHPVGGSAYAYSYNKRYSKTSLDFKFDKIKKNS
jgi:predicted phosphodiesterase